MTTGNQTQHDTWNGDSGHRWAADADRRDAVLAPVADALLAATHIQPGESILDLGCGCGTTTLTAASRGEPGGTAHGIDLSAPMLFCRPPNAPAVQESPTSPSRQADAQAYRLDGARPTPSSAASAPCSSPTPSPPSQHRARLRPGGRLCIATWQPLVPNDWLSVPGAALLRYGTLPDSHPAPRHVRPGRPRPPRSHSAAPATAVDAKPSMSPSPSATTRTTPPTTSPTAAPVGPSSTPSRRQARCARRRRRHARPPHHQPGRPPRCSHLDHHRHCDDIAPPDPARASTGSTR